MIDLQGRSYPTHQLRNKVARRYIEIHIYSCCIHLEIAAAAAAAYAVAGVLNNRPRALGSFSFAYVLFDAVEVPEVASDHVVSIISFLSSHKYSPRIVKVAVIQTETFHARISKHIKRHLCNATTLMAVLSLLMETYSHSPTPSRNVFSLSVLVLSPATKGGPEYVYCYTC